ncbi:MAG TPA: GIY-YIG nuclease family protein [Chthoniobacterales bacterium]|nr:GIY-YIG nuclease family protein [Chthoniobacterales bacterium]
MRCSSGVLRFETISRRGEAKVDVYILQSEVEPARFYTGCTRDLRERVDRHNAGQVRHTAKWKPWRLKTYIAFSDEARARDLEQYLKSSSGRAFTKKRL